MCPVRRLYLDYNASTPLLPAAREAFLESLDSFGNPSSTHQEGRQAKAILQKARKTIATLIEAKAEDVIFTSGATEAAAMLLTPYYFMGRSPLYLSHLYFSATEHPCITAGGRFPHERTSIIPVNSKGIVNGQSLETMLQHHDYSKGLPLVAIQYANHETGVIQPIEELSEIIKKFGGIFIMDIVQALGKKNLDHLINYGDFFILSAHKIGGAKGVGAIVANGSMLRPQPLLAGGGQERGLRSGTEAVSLIAAFGAAASEIIHGSNDEDDLKQLQNQLENGLKTMVPDITIYGAGTERLVNTSFVSIPGWKGETLQIALDLENIAVSAGASCSSGKIGLSPVLQAMGFSNIMGGIRISTGKNVKSQDVEHFLSVIKNIIFR